MSPQHAVDVHTPLRDVANLRARETASDGMRAIQIFDILDFAGRSNATQKLWALGPFPSEFEYAGGQLIAAAVIIAAELVVPREYDEE